MDDILALKIVQLITNNRYYGPLDKVDVMVS